MRIPKRRAQLLKLHTDDGPVHLTADGFARLKRERERLDAVDRPKAVEDVAEARQKGDLSENAEYQEARARLSRIQSRLFNIDERLKRVRMIEKQEDGRIALGSTVVLRRGQTTKTYALVGPHEADILRGKISHLSPLGSALLNHTVGESITIPTQNGEASYEIIEVR